MTGGHGWLELLGNLLREAAAGEPPPGGLHSQGPPPPSRPPQGHKEEARTPRFPTKLDGTTIEEVAGHRWRETSLPPQALTHSSYSDNRVKEGHEGLELLGNAAVDYLVNGYTDADPGQLTNIWSELVKNSYFTSLLNSPSKPVFTQPPTPSGVGIAGATYLYAATDDKRKQNKL